MKCRLKDPISAISDSDSPVFGMRLEDVNGELIAFRVPSKDTLSLAYRVLIESGDISYKMNYDAFDKYFIEDAQVPSDSDLGVGDFEEVIHYEVTQHDILTGVAYPTIDCDSASSGKIKKYGNYITTLIISEVTCPKCLELIAKREKLKGPEYYTGGSARSSVEVHRPKNINNVDTVEVRKDPPSVYHKWFDEGYHDVYSIARKFDITDPAQAHGLKKNLIAGGRNKVGKTAIDDIKECIWSLQNYLEYLESLDEK